jgi:hypothetical protein
MKKGRTSRGKIRRGMFRFYVAWVGSLEMNLDSESEIRTENVRTTTHLFWERAMWTFGVFSLPHPSQMSYAKRRCLLAPYLLLNITISLGWKSRVKFFKSSLMYWWWTGSSPVQIRQAKMDFERGENWSYYISHERVVSRHENSEEKGLGLRTWQ